MGKAPAGSRNDVVRAPVGDGTGGRRRTEHRDGRVLVSRPRRPPSGSPARERGELTQPPSLGLACGRDDADEGGRAGKADAVDLPGSGQRLGATRGMGRDSGIEVTPCVATGQGSAVKRVGGVLSVDRLIGSSFSSRRADEATPARPADEVAARHGSAPNGAERWCSAPDHGGVDDGRAVAQYRRSRSPGR